MSAKPYESILDWAKRTSAKRLAEMAPVRKRRGPKAGWRNPGGVSETVDKLLATGEPFDVWDVVESCTSKPAPSLNHVRVVIGQRLRSRRAMVLAPGSGGRGLPKYAVWKGAAAAMLAAVMLTGCTVGPHGLQWFWAPKAQSWTGTGTNSVSGGQR